MAGKTQIELELIALTKQAQADVKKFADESNKQLSNISMATAFSAIKDGFDLVSGLAGKVGGFFAKAIEEASQAEEEMRALNNAMRINGEYSAEASARAKDYSDELAKVSRATNTQVVSALGLAANYGLANSESRKLVSAAADLAAITDGDLNNATRKLANTYSGVLSKDLARMIPELEGLTKAQLRNGAAVDLLARKLKGSAEDSLKSYAGQLAQARKEVDNFYESIGNVAIRVTAFLIRDTIALKNNIVSLLEVIKRDSTIPERPDTTREKAIAASKAARELDIKEYQAEQRAQRKRIADAAAEEAKDRLEAFRAGWISKRKELELASLDASAKINKKYLDDEKEVRKAFSLGLIKSKQEERILIEGLENNRKKDLAAEEARQRAEINAIVKSSLTDRERIELDYQERRKLIEEQFRLGHISSEKEKNEIIKGLDRNRLKDLAEETESAYQKLSAKNARFATDTYNALAESYRKGQKLSQDEAISAGAGIIANVMKGAEGARQAIGAIAGAVANYFIPGIGAAVNEIVQGLSKGPEYVKQMVNDFEHAVPQLLTNIVDAIPVLLETIVDNIPYVIEKSIELIPRIFSMLLNIWPKLVNRLIEMAPQIIQAFVKGFIKAIPEMFKAFGQALYDSATKFVEAILNAVSDIGGSVGGALGIGGNGDGGFLQQVFDPLGIFATGGRVPDSPRYQGDRFPAMLDQGEQVFSRDLTKRLENFLDGGGSKGGGQQEAYVVHNHTYVGGRKVAETIYDLDRRGFRLRKARA